MKFHQIWTRSRASADPDAPHGPGSDIKGYLGTDHTQGIPEQPEITRDCLISQNGRVHKVFVHMLRRIISRPSPSQVVCVLVWGCAGLCGCRVASAVQYSRWFHGFNSQINHFRQKESKRYKIAKTQKPGAVEQSPLLSRAHCANSSQSAELKINLGLK